MLWFTKSQLFMTYLKESMETCFCCRVKKKVIAIIISPSCDLIFSNCYFIPAVTLYLEMWSLYFWFSSVFFFFFFTLRQKQGSARTQLSIWCCFFVLFFVYRLYNFRRGSIMITWDGIEEPPMNAFDYTKEGTSVRRQFDPWKLWMQAMREAWKKYSHLILSNCDVF